MKSSVMATSMCTKCTIIQREKYTLRAKSGHDHELIAELSLSVCELRILTSVADPFYSDTEPDPWIRFVEKRIWILIRPKIPTFFLEAFL